MTIADIMFNLHGVKPASRMVLAYLLSNKVDGRVASMTLEDMATNLGLTREGLRKILNSLETKGYLRVERAGHFPSTNIYYPIMDYIRAALII